MPTRDPLGERHPKPTAHPVGVVRKSPGPTDANGGHSGEAGLHSWSATGLKHRPEKPCPFFWQFL
jgi:hypothetical protein